MASSAPASRVGYAARLAWAHGLGQVEAWGVEAPAATARGWPASWPLAASTWCSLVGVPPAEKFRRQIQAG
jgi:hypothetical protein